MDIFEKSKLIELMKAHDWFYEFSDDHKTWSRGLAQRAEILALLKKLPENVAFEIIATHAPNNSEIRKTWFKLIAGGK